MRIGKAYYKLLDQLNDSIIVTDSNDNVIFHNASAASLLETKGAAIELSQPLSVFHFFAHNDSAKFVLAELQEHATRQTRQLEIKRENGVTLYYEISFYPITDEQGIPLKAILVNDITPEKTFENKSLRLLKQFSTLIENANAVIFSTDSREYITDWNKECAAVTGFAKNEVLARKLSDILSKTTYADFIEIFQQTLSGKEVSGREIVMQEKNGRVLNLLLNATPQFNSSDNVIGVLFVGNDITELTSYRQSLEQIVLDRTERLKAALESEKELVNIKNGFISVASHEFKIPLSSISASVNTLKANPHLSESDFESLSAVESQVRYMRSLLDDILTLKQTEVQSLKANDEDVEIIGFLKGLFPEVLAGNCHQIKCDFEWEELLIKADQKLLRNVFVNILSNAIKFSPDDGKIFVSARSFLDQQIQIRVKDNGIGIPEDEISNVTEPFTRASNAGTINGTGLGLSIVKKAVKALNGRMAIESKPGEGTAIDIYLYKTQRKP